MSSTIDSCGEGPVDAAIARRLIACAGGHPGKDLLTPRGRRGKDALDARIPGLIIAAEHGHCVLVLRDLDAEPCAGPVVRRLAPRPPPTFCLRLAVRAVEAWLLADHDGMARRLRVAKAVLPDDPETLSDPKGAFRRIVRVAKAVLPDDPETLSDPKGAFRRLVQASRDTSIRIQSAATPQALGVLTSTLAAEFWDPVRAQKRSPSLARALMRL